VFKNQALEKVLENLLPFLDTVDLLVCRTVCKSWHDFLGKNPTWRQFRVFDKKFNLSDWEKLLNLPQNIKSIELVKMQIDQTDQIDNST